MKHACGFFLLLLAVVGSSAWAKSLLEPAKFPKTINDVSFIDRLILEADGYDDFETIFDANGNCISGCAYKGMTLEDAIAASERATREAAAKLALYKAQHPEEFQDELPEPKPPRGPDNPPNIPPDNPPDNPPNIPPDNPPDNPPDIPPNNPPDDIGEYSCPTNKFSKNIPKGRNVVDNAPLDTDLIVTSDIGERSVSGGSSWHQGLDLRAADGTPVYLPANGEVKAVTGSNSGSGGYYIWVYHPTEQIYTRYMHLSAQLVKVGDKVIGGCMIAKSGHSGKSRSGKAYPAHLHYEIKKTMTNNRTDVIDPFGEGINRLGRGYKFKSKSSMRPSRGGKLPIGCIGFL